MFQLLSSTKEIVKNVKVDYSLYYPDSVPDKFYPPGLIVYLHSAGMNRCRRLGDTIVDQIPEKYRNQFAVLSIYADDDNIFHNDQIRLAIEETLKTQDVHHKKIYLIGFSLGARGAWSFLSEYSKMVTAAVIMSGYSLPFAAGQMKDIPIWVIHGKKDNVVPFEESRKMVDALRSKGASRIIFSALENDGHTTEGAISVEKVYEWLETHKNETRG